MNSITICGNLTRDPELKYTQSGKPMAVFSVADNRTKDKTLFFDCTAFDDAAERILQYFKKGKPIFLTGTFDTREYTDRHGKDRTALQVRVSSWDFVNSGRQDGTERGNAQAAREAQGDEVPEISDPFADQ